MLLSQVLNTLYMEKSMMEGTPKQKGDNDLSWYQTLDPKCIQGKPIVVQEKVLKEFRESGCDSNLTKYEKDKLKQLLKLGEKGPKRKTRKDMPTRNSMKHSYSRAPKSASPLLLNRGHQEHSESGDELYQEAEEYEDDDIDDHDSYENPDNIIENELENESYADFTPTAPTYDEQDLNNNGESLEDLGKFNLRELIYKMFLNIYNSEKENTERLRREIFPKITEETKLDDYITYAINNCMDHVKDELQIFIKKNLKLQRKKLEGPQKSMIKDSSFIPVDENIQKYNELIDKIIDFYELFKCSIEHIEAAWKEKLGHIDRLYDIFDYRHKKLFSVNIWQDREIREVIKLFFSQNYDYESYKKRTEDINTIEQELNENLQSIEQSEVK